MMKNGDALQEDAIDVNEHELGVAGLIFSCRNVFICRVMVFIFVTGR